MHTPGPWYVNGDCVEADGPEGPRDVTVVVVPRVRETGFDDARLISAAPDMLAALQAFRDAYHFGNVDDPRRNNRLFSAYQLARDALDKAQPPYLEDM